MGLFWRFGLGALEPDRGELTALSMGEPSAPDLEGP